MPAPLRCIVFGVAMVQSDAVLAAVPGLRVRARCISASIGPPNPIQQFMPIPLSGPRRELKRGSMTETEVRIVTAAMAGDPEAFRELVEQYHRIVLGMVYKLLAPRTPQDAEDYAQDIFVKLSKTIVSFDFSKKTKFSTWFYTFIRNHCFDLMRKRRLRTVPLQPARRDDDRRPAPELACETATPAEASESGEVRFLLASTLAELPDPERLVFVMREIEGREYREIADDLGIAEGTAKARLYRAKETLRTRLGPYLRDGSLVVRADAPTTGAPVRKDFGASA